MRAGLFPGVEPGPEARSMACASLPDNDPATTANPWGRAPAGT